MAKSPEHTRVNDILLGALERPALKWLAAHTPKWITPDIYTGIGVLGGLVILAGYFLSRFHPAWFWLASLGFVINWLGDSLDGTLARHRHIERPVFGFYIDHVVDAIIEAIVFIGLGLSPYINFSIALLALIAYLLLSILVYVRTAVIAEFKISYGKLGPTEVRVIAILLNTTMFFAGPHGWQVSLGSLGSWILTPYDLAVAAIGLLLLFFFLSTAWKEALRLGKENR